MDEYYDLMNEYENVKKTLSKELEALTLYLMRIKGFQNGINSFLSQIKILIDNDQTTIKSAIDENCLKFCQNIERGNSQVTSDIIQPFNSLIDTLTDSNKKNLNLFDNIKISLIQSMHKVKDAKEQYFKHIESANNIDNNNEDNNALYLAKKNNFYQLYKYEVEQLNSKIDDNNKKYSEMYNNIFVFKQVMRHSINQFFKKFAEYIKRVSVLIDEYSTNLTKILDNNNEKFLDINKLNEEKKSIKNPRFNKIKMVEEDNKTKKLTWDLMNDINDNKKEEKVNKKSKKKTKTDDVKEDSKSKSANQRLDEFEIIDITSCEEDKDYEKKFDNLIKKILSKEELLSDERSSLMNLIKDKGRDYALIFLNKLIKLSSKKTIDLKNSQNFLHLANILNDISFKENKIETLKLIIEVSQVITYKDWHLFNLLQRKNKYLTTKTFWSKIIYDSFIPELNKEANTYIEQSKKEKKKKESKKDKEIKFILQTQNFSNNITNYKKLTIEQKTKLDNYAKMNIKNILIKAIEGMCSFLVPETVALDVIDDYEKPFGLNKKYYKCLLEVYMNRNYIYNLKNISLKDSKTKREAVICIISNAAKFLPKTNLTLLLLIQKDMTEEMRKNIFKNYLHDPNLSIDERTKIWGYMLNVKKIQEDFNYEEEKEKVLKLINDKKIEPESKLAENFELIDLDIKRTYFKDKVDSLEYQKVVKNILLTVINLNQDIGYYQGMNYIVAFFYQIFEYDEKKTFYYMLALEKNTKYRKIFENSLDLLTNFFQVFDNILKINMPEIYHHLKNHSITAHLYVPPWFLTLFTFLSISFTLFSISSFSMVFSLILFLRSNLLLNILF